MSRRAFTIVEVLIVIGVVGVLVAIAYPVIGNSKRAARYSACQASLREIGVSLNMYRSDYGGSEVGWPTQMGLPPFRIDLYQTVQLRCLGNNPDGNGWYYSYPDTYAPAHVQDAWAAYVDKYGSSSIVFYDPNHQSEYPRSITWQLWKAAGLRLDGSVTSRTRMGFPMFPKWWHDNVGGNQ